MSLTSVKTVSALLAGGAVALALSALYRGVGREADPVPDVAHAAHEAALAERFTQSLGRRSSRARPSRSATTRS
jgi:hypothetical protein